MNGLHLAQLKFLIGIDEAMSRKAVSREHRLHKVAILFGDIEGMPIERSRQTTHIVDIKPGDRSLRVLEADAKTGCSRWYGRRLVNLCCAYSYFRLRQIGCGLEGLRKEPMLSFGCRTLPVVFPKKLWLKRTSGLREGKLLRENANLAVARI